MESLILIVVTFLFFLMRQVGLPKRIHQSQLSPFKQIGYMTSGLVLVGLVLIKSIISINADQVKDISAQISFPTIELEETTESNRTLMQIFFVNLNCQSLIHFEENIYEEGNNQSSGAFQYKGFNIEYSTELFPTKSAINKFYQGKYRVSTEARSNTGKRIADSHSSYIILQENYDEIFSSRLKPLESFFELSRGSEERIIGYVMCYRLHPDDKLKTISKSELLNKIDFSLDQDMRIRYSRTEGPFYELMSVIGLSCLILLTGIVLIAHGSNRNYAFPVVLFTVILCIIGVKKYEYSSYESIALNEDKSPNERKLAIRNAKEMPFFKVSAETLEKNLNP